VPSLSRMTSAPHLRASSSVSFSYPASPGRVKPPFIFDMSKSPKTRSKLNLRCSPAFPAEQSRPDRAAQGAGKRERRDLVARHQDGTGNHQVKQDGKPEQCRSTPVSAPNQETKADRASAIQLQRHEKQKQAQNNDE